VSRAKIPGSGRKKGTPNKATRDVRKAFAALLERSAPKLASWLDQVAADDPARALDIVTRLAEYHIPKLAKSEHKVEELSTVRIVNLTGVRVGGGGK
jgi:hypothetical protein